MKQIGKQIKRHIHTRGKSTETENKAKNAPKKQNKNKNPWSSFCIGQIHWA